MSSTPIVSVWIITYNQEPYIRQALDSALAQKTDFTYEIVIGEDYSTDNTRQILLEYKNKYPETITLLLHDQNIGMINNQNETFNACRGSYIALLEGDDYWNDVNKLQKQYDAMQAHAQCQLSFHPVYTTKHETLNDYGDTIKVIPVEEGIKVGGYYISTPSIMIKKNILSEMPSFLNSAPAGDYYLQIFGSIAGGALYIPKVMATYRLEAHGSWSQSIYDDNIKIKFIEETLALIMKLDNYLEYKYTKAFQYKYMTATMTLTTTYLHNSRNLDFKDTLIKASNYISEPSISFQIKYHLRNFPSVALFISRVFTKIKRVRQEFFQNRTSKQPTDKL